MLKNEIHVDSGVVERKEKIEAALRRLKSLKSHAAELRLQCEDFRKQRLVEQSVTLVCSECGKQITHDQEVTLRDSFGKVKSYYHRNCFKAIWLSQIWRFDYTSPGFLRLSEKRC